MTPLQWLERLMRQPDAFLRSLGLSPQPAIAGAPEVETEAPPADAARLDEDAPRRFAHRDQLRVLLCALFAAAGLFGAVVGGGRGAVQALYCAVKVPLLLLITLVISTPPLLTLSRALGAAAPARALIALSLGSCTRFALVLAGLAPLLWLAQGWASYHAVILCTVLSCAIAGAAAGALLFRGLPGSPLLGVGFVVVFALVGAHTSWLLRPFVVRPRTVEVPFVRALEGDLLDAVTTSARSAAGVYDPRPGCGDASCE